MDMRKDTTPTTDAATLDTIKAADAHQQTASGRPSQETSPADLQSFEAPATSGHIEAQEPRKGDRKRRKDNTSTAAHMRYMSKSYDRMELQLIKGDKERLRAAAARLDISPTALIIKAVNAYTNAETLTEKAKNPYI